jgi:hypothetical protein
VSGTERRYRVKTIQIRVSEEELALIREDADRAGVTLASHARQVLLFAPAPRSVRRPPIDRTAIAQALAVLGPIGGDIRELVAAMKTAAPDSALAARLTETIGELSDARDALMRALRRDP